MTTLRSLTTPQTRCVLGFARADITPPVGIYHRMWGAAKHDQATGVHRPLTATALWLAARDGRSATVVLGLDHCILDAVETMAIRERAGAAVGIAAADVQVCLSHT